MDFDLLRRLCETPGIASREDAVRDLVIQEMQPLLGEGGSIRVDALGNVIAHKKGMGGPKVLIATHMDEIGFLVRHIDDKGFLRLHPVGGFDPRVLIAQRVHVHGVSGETFLGIVQPAQKPVHQLSPEDRNKVPKLNELFVDIGLTRDQISNRIEIGDMVTLARTCEAMGVHAVSKALDNRISVYVLLETLRLVGAHQCEIYAVATVQEEVGLRGATVAAYGVEPDIAIAIDVTLANDFPGTSDTEQVSNLGKGPALKIADNSMLSNPKLLRHVRDVAEYHDIPYQLEILSGGGTDAGGMQRVRSGVASFTVSIPCRYVHTVNEMVSMQDVDCAVTLMTQYLEEAHTRSYGYDVKEPSRDEETKRDES